MEETIGYEALFSAEEWDATDKGDWSLADEDLELAATDPDTPHPVRVYETSGGFEAECELCGAIGTSDSEPEAHAVARLHEAFVATLAENWTVRS